MVNRQLALDNCARGTWGRLNIHSVSRLTQTNSNKMWTGQLKSCCMQSASGSLADVRLSHRDSSSPWNHSSESAQAQDRLVLRVPSPSPFSSMEPVTALRAASLSGKSSPPPFRQGTSRQNGPANMPRMLSLASSGHRKRQLSFSSLSLDTLDTEWHHILYIMHSVLAMIVTQMQICVLAMILTQMQVCMQTCLRLQSWLPYSIAHDHARIYTLLCNWCSKGLPVQQSRNHAWPRSRRVCRLWLETDQTVLTPSVGSLLKQTCTLLRSQQHSRSGCTATLLSRFYSGTWAYSMNEVYSKTRLKCLSIAQMRLIVRLARWQNLKLAW